MKLSDAIEAYFEENDTDGPIVSLLIREVKKLEDQLEEWGKTPKLPQENTVGELIAEGLEEVADTVASTQEEYRGYVIRTHSLVNPDAILGFVAMEGELGASLGHLARKVYVSELVAIEDAAKYNRLNPSLCFAVVIPNGTEKDCLTAKPLWEEEQ